MTSINQLISLPVLKETGVTLHLKREDHIHPVISGNKYRKLKYNILEAKAKGITTLLTFGGAFSNHIVATACAGQEHGFKTIGIIRGEELVSKWQENPSLSIAKRYGMDFKFIPRETYRHKNSPVFLEGLQREFGSCFILPEGGTNTFAVKGCEEILVPGDTEFDVVCCCVGTGGTMAGLINAAAPHQKILGFPALKGEFLQKDICSFVQRDNWALQNNYHFGGYAKVDAGLVQFINDFKMSTGIPLDPIYTGKMLYGILDLVQKGIFLPGTRILAIHSGGLQGIPGMNMKLKNRNLPLLDL